MKLGSQEIQSEDLDCIQLVRIGMKWWTVENTVMYGKGTKNFGNILPGSATNSA